MTWQDVITPDEQAELEPADGARLAAFRIVVVLAQHLRTIVDRALADIELTTQQAAVVTIVRLAAPRGPTLADVARALGTSHQNAKQIAAALERKGLLRIDVDPDDARARRLHTTPRNERLWQRREPADRDAVLEVFGALSGREANQLIALLRPVYARALATRATKAE